MAVGELFLSALITVLFEKLASTELLNLVTEEGIRPKIDNWKNTLEMIKKLLIDAEEKQLRRGSVKEWLDDLQDLAYDVEDILDEFSTAALSRKLMADRQANTSKICSLTPAWVSCLNPSVIKFNMSMRSKINEITSRLDQIYMRRERIGLEEIPGSTSNVAWEGRQSTSTPTEPAIYGRDEDKAKILDVVFDDEARGTAKFCVIPIVGMGGIGKTTLAREVYNDEAMKDFKPKAWVCVSDDSNDLRITKDILESVTGSSCDLNTLDSVQNKLKQAVSENKFLLVLDDIWKMNFDLWERLKSPLMVGAAGSLIIVTTRDKEIASTIAGPDKYHQLKTLKDDDCWSLLMKHAFVGRDIGAHVDLEFIRQKVVDKCQGLPLAARTLGGLLYSKRSDEWEDILRNEIWGLTDNGNILPALKLSYHYLPAHLKRCFAYCAIFPKDYEFEEKELVLLWMGEGLIRQPTDNQHLEDVGSQYFRNLVSRSIFQQSSNRESKFTMHDLIHDLAERVSEEICFRLEDKLAAKIQSKRLERVRHFSYPWSLYQSKDKCEVFNKVKHLRTLFPVRTSTRFSEGWIEPTVWGERWGYISNAVLDLLPKLKRLRVLSFEDYAITELPDSIRSLRHLRYLNLVNSKIKSLPESISSLFNLQILILRNCSSLLMLPSSMRNLINLQYLDILGATLLREMPIGMEDLRCLLRLSNFIVGKESGSSLIDLASLKSLRRELSISNLENAVDLQDAGVLILSDMADLEVLLLEWGLEFDDSRNEVAEGNALNMLRPHKNLKQLTIRGFAGTRFSSWLGDPSFSKIVDLRLESCVNCTSLPPLGLLGSLKSLSIERMEKLKSIGFEFYGEGCLKPFPSLETVSFTSIEEWEHWEPTPENEHVEIFPRLRELSILFCPKLSGRLPEHLPLVEKLVISSCAELAISLSSFPLLHKLRINDCKQLALSSPVDYKSLNSTCLSNVSLMGNWLRQGFQKVESLRILNCKEVTDMWKNRSFLEKPPQVLQSFNSLRKLWISRCHGLTSLPTEIQLMGTLESLRISSCESLEYIIRGQPSPTLKELYTTHCEKLQCLFEDKHVADISASQSTSSLVKNEDNIHDTGSSLLEILHVQGCPSLTCLSSTGQLPATLNDLDIRKCSNLKTLASRGELLPKALKSLKISSCPRLESVAEKFYNNTPLKYIFIVGCESLKSIPKGLHTLNKLYQICVMDCPSLVSFPEGGLPSNSALVTIFDCEKLKAIPNHMHSLNSLRQLEVRRCPSIVSFPEEGLPTCLTDLKIEDLNKNIYNQIISWVWAGLTSLTVLEITGCPNVVSFPPEEMRIMLPSSLTRLTIGKFPKLRYLSSKGFKDLNSLKLLAIFGCPKLETARSPILTFDTKNL